MFDGLVVMPGGHCTHPTRGPAIRLKHKKKPMLSHQANMYGLLTKREVKMTGYWPSSFFACLWTETKSRSINTQKQNEANIQSS